MREDLNARCRRVDGRRAAAAGRARELPRGAGGRVRRALASGGPVAGRARRFRFARGVYIERDDFAEVPPKGWFRLAPGGEVRLRYACIIKCERRREGRRGRGRRAPLHVGPGLARRQREGRAQGQGHAPLGVREARRRRRRCASTTASSRRSSPARRTRATTSSTDLNPESLEIARGRASSRRSRRSKPGERVQFERVGYFCVDPDSTAGRARLQPDDRPQGLVGGEAEVTPRRPERLVVIAAVGSPAAAPVASASAVAAAWAPPEWRPPACT